MSPNGIQLALICRLWAGKFIFSRDVDIDVSLHRITVFRTWLNNMIWVNLKANYVLTKILLLPNQDNTKSFYRSSVKKHFF